MIVKVAARDRERRGAWVMARRIGRSVYLLFLVAGFPPCIAGIFAVLVGVAPVCAQERNPFFEKDYAKNPLEEKPTQGVRVPSVAIPNAEGATPIPEVEADSTNPMDQLKSKLEALQSGEVAGPLDLTALERTYKVISVGGILNALDKVHFQEKARELLEVVERHDLDVGFIWAVGSFDNLTTVPEMMSLVARNGVGELAERTTEKYATVKISPTWILRTPDGDIVLEGTGPLAQHFNVRGEFVRKGSAEAVVTPTSGDAAVTPPDTLPKVTPSPVPTPSPTPDTLFGSTQPSM